MNKPRISLVGAGPGHSDLITLKGIRAIQQADVIMYDALANHELLDFAQPNTPSFFVGKRCGNHTFNQTQINDLIVENALKYGHVVRLKGGDPFVLGRGYEELAHAQAHNIPCEVVPGISSAIAVPSSFGIPVTSRGYAESFWVITGTSKTGLLSANIKLAAQSTATIVILMGMHKLQEIVKIFEAAGKNQSPMAIIQEGTRANERCVIGSVNEILLKVSAYNITNPAVIVIGEVVRLGQETKDMAIERLYNLQK